MFGIDRTSAAGEPIAEDDDLFGASVIVAARIAAKADGGEVLVSAVVRQLVTGKEFLFSDTGGAPGCVTVPSARSAMTGGVGRTVP